MDSLSTKIHTNETMRNYLKAISLILHEIISENKSEIDKQEKFRSIIIL
jgi:hypothetical protein